MLNGHRQAAHGFYQAGNDEKADERRHQQHHQVGQGDSQGPLQPFPYFGPGTGKGAKGDILKKADEHIEDIGNDQPPEHRREGVQQGKASGPYLVKAQHGQHGQGGKGNQQAAGVKGAPVGRGAEVFVRHEHSPQVLV